MGSAHAPPPIDYRIERVKKIFDIPDKQLEKLWHLFLMNDRDKKGIVMIQDFFEQILHYDRSPLTDNLLGLIETKHEGSLDYGEFVELIATFCSFEEPQLLRYFFYIMDPHRVGLIEGAELKHMLMAIHSNHGLIREALDYVSEECGGEDHTFTHEELLIFKSKFPYALYPLFQLHTHMIQHTLGERWWENYKLHHQDKKDEKRAKELAKLEKDRRESEKEKEMATEEVLKKRMGIKYYLMPWQRVAEQRKLARIAAIEADMEKQQPGRKV